MKISKKIIILSLLSTIFLSTPNYAASMKTLSKEKNSNPPRIISVSVIPKLPQQGIWIALPKGKGKL